MSGKDSIIRREAFSPDGKTLASYGGLCNLVRFWNVVTSQRLDPLEAHTAIILGIALSPNGRFMASAGHDNRVKLWWRDESREGWSHRASFLHDALVQTLAFSPDGQFLATGGGDNLVTIWDVHLEEKIRTLRGHSGAVTSMAFLSDGALVSGSADGTVRMWEPPSGPERGRLVQMGIIVNMSLSRDGKTLATSDPNHSRVHLWDIASQTKIHSFTGKSGFAANVAISPDRMFLAIHRKDDVLQLWSLPHHETPLVTLDNQLVSIGHNVAFSPDSQTVVFPSSTDAVTLWDVVNNRKIGEFSLRLNHPEAFGLAFSPGGDRLAIVAAGEVSLWGVKTQTLVRRLGTVGRGIRSVAFSPDGKLLALPTDATVIGVWDWEKNREIASFQGHTAYIDTVAFSPGGNTLASASYDGTVKLWNLEIEQCVATLRGHLGPLSDLLFSADGTALYSAAGDATVKRWPIATFAAIAAMKSE
ncbi:MAG: WD40 repeat domain-containing protein [Verrucomicrobiia bacterium]